MAKWVQLKGKMPEHMNGKAVVVKIVHWGKTAYFGMCVVEGRLLILSVGAGDNNESTVISTGFDFNKADAVYWLDESEDGDNA